MKSQTRKMLIGMLLTIVAVLIVSYLTVNNCTDEQLKWTPLIIVITMVLVIATGFINALIQDMSDKPESI
jgi:flagellar biosynthesis protein FliQ